MLYNNFIVFDLETGGKNPRECPPIQIGAMAINPHTLGWIRDEKGEPVFFNSMMRPDDMSKVEDEALAVNKKTREEIEAAPCEEVVFKNFVSWTRQFNYKGNNDQWSAPIACGFNILNFDMVIIERLAHKYGFINKENKQSIFHKIYFHDVMNLAAYWHHGQKDPSKYNLKSLAEYYGIDMNGAHDALFDVEVTGKILIKFFKLGQNPKLREKIKFKDSFKSETA